MCSPGVIRSVPVPDRDFQGERSISHKERPGSEASGHALDRCTCAASWSCQRRSGTGGRVCGLEPPEDGTGLGPPVWSFCWILNWPPPPAFP